MLKGKLWVRGRDNYITHIDICTKEFSSPREFMESLCVSGYVTIQGENGTVAFNMRNIVSMSFEEEKDAT